MKIPAKYFFIAAWLALMLLLFVMFGLAHFPLKGAGTTAILVCAVIQMVLVMLIFMRLRSSTKVVRLAAGVGFFWLLILFVLAFSDYLTRQWH